ncbi:hybrid sensor histidine kinase/response regulator transcription factor [Reichenbachiella sp.]|uniref:hybrid sensor histidine kinase/response regulator transcription factor n=1 Tax=Reichenbachiella sp. TaxID=2184521 RepID=UPI003BAE2552
MRKYLVTTIHLSKGVLLIGLVMLLTFSGISPVVGQNAPDLKFRYYGLEHGLSQVTAICLLEDQQGYIWVGTQDGLNRFDGYHFKPFRSNPEDPSSLSNGHINCMVEDSSGRVLVGTKNGLSLFDAKKETFDVLLNEPARANSLSHNHVTALFEDSKNQIWVGTENGLNLLNSDASGFDHYDESPSSSTVLSNNYITSLEEDDKGNLWIGTKKGLNVLDIENRMVRSLYHDSANKFTLSSDEITKVFQDSKQQIWVGTRDGLNLYAPENKNFRRYLYDSDDETSINDNHVLSIYQDSNADLWIGTANGGLNLLNVANDTFVRYQHNEDDPKSLSNNTVWSILEDRSKNLWVGVSNKGVNFHDPRTRTFTHYQYSPDNSISLQDNAVRSVLLDDQNQLWVGSFTGLTVIDRKNNTSRRYRHNVGDSYSLSANYVLSLYQDHKNRIWIGTRNGLNLYEPKGDHFIRFEGNDKVSMKDIGIESILQDHQHQLWVGTNKKGVFRIDLDEGKIKRYAIKNDKTNFNQSTAACIVQDTENRIWVGSAAGLFLFDFKEDIFKLVESKVLSSNEVTNITEEPNGRIWIGSKSGFHLFDPKTKTLKSYHEKDGLSNAFIYGALADDTGNLWLSTNKGLNKFVPDQGTFTVYDHADGLQSDEFNGKAYHKDRNGFMYFGGVNGLSVFHPDSVGENTDLPQVVWTDFLLFNQSVQVNDSSVLKHALNHEEKIVLNYDQDMFAFEFAALNYKQPEKNQFAYKLEPFNEDWIYTDYKDRKAVFTRIPAGSYTFSVKASNDDGHWNEQARSIKLTILPPWWKSWWAMSLYAIVSLATIFLIARFQWRRIQLKNRLKLERKEAEQFKALDRLKTQFFSNITHEFRTPLTLILGPSEQILKQNKLDESFTRSQVELIRRNSKKFLQLINQLLDLSKLEDQQMSVELYRGSLNEFVKNVVENFQSAAYQKHIRLNLDSQLPISYHLFDRDKLDKIIYNLLSNALKFTPEEGTIDVTIGPSEVDGNSIALSVKDSGIGIAEDKLPYIFDRFYQVEGATTREYEGTGIGLALTKELIELQGGTIRVSSEVSKGTQFVVELPIEQVSSSEISTSQVDEASEIHQTFVLDDLPQVENQGIDPESEKQVILIVEDNNDLRTFIQSVLQEKYQTLMASDGAEGVALALKHIPDLIICDVMMPEKDGFELTKALKNNSLSSHVPIILLTAKSTLKSRVEGLESGADAYLNKPFSVDELLLTVNHQIQTRRLLQSKYTIGSKDSEEGEGGYSLMDQELMDRLHALIEAQLSNEEFSVDELIGEIGMSHSQLYRKIKALTNLSIAGFIRNYRLQRAFELLKSGTHNVTEVADMTGFGNRRYFHKVFVEKYNFPPSQILKSL